MCDTCSREYRNHMIVVVRPFDKLWKIKKYCKTLIVDGYFYLGLLEVKNKNRQN